MAPLPPPDDDGRHHRAPPLPPYAPRPTTSDDLYALLSLDPARLRSLASTAAAAAAGAAGTTTANGKSSTAAAAAVAAEVRRAFNAAARRAHPDKGGSAAAFAAARLAFETLSDPARRAVYDAHAHNRGGRGARFPATAAGGWRGAGAVPGEEAFEVPGAEGALLAELAARAAAAGRAPPDAKTQLVVVCGLCGRPATQECWTCGLPICALCGRRRHFRGGVPLHWPLVDAPGRMEELLGRQELEKKRIEDGRAALRALAPPAGAAGAALPLLTPAAAARAAAEFEALWARQQQPVGGGMSNEAEPSAAAAIDFVQARAPLAAALGRYRLWAQTDASVYVAVCDPSAAAAASAAGQGGAALALPPPPPTAGCGLGTAVVASAAAAAAAVLPTISVELIPGGGLLAGCAPRRRPAAAGLWARGVDAAAGAACWSLGSGGSVEGSGSSGGGGGGSGIAVVRVAKARPGEAWPALFRGDSWGARCLAPPYSITYSAADVTLELPLPRWVVPAEDLDVLVTPAGVTVSVDGLQAPPLQRAFGAAFAGRVDAGNVAWSVAGDGGGSGASGKAGGGKTLTLVLPLRPADGDGRDSAQQKRRAGGNGADASAAPPPLFAEDEDALRLAPLLIAAMFADEGRAFVPHALASGPQRRWWH